MSAGGSVDATEMALLQRMARLMPPLCKSCAAAKVADYQFQGTSKNQQTRFSPMSIQFFTLYDLQLI